MIVFMRVGQIVFLKSVSALFGSLGGAQMLLRPGRDGCALMSWKVVGLSGIEPASTG